VTWRPKIEKILWYAAVAICSAGMLGWLRAIEIWYQYWNLPHSPNPATANIYPMNIGGYVVYQTLKEQLRRERWEFWSLAVLGFGIALGVFHKWMTAKHQGR
jgi:hypothetical protein